MSWSWAALMPHPPIMVPEVGCGREREAKITLEGAEKMVKRLTGRKPDCLLLLSPHQPYSPGALFLNGAPRTEGSLGLFGAPEVTFSLETPLKKRELLAAYLSEKGFAVQERTVPNLSSDQGTLVPLYFLSQAWGGTLPPVILASPIGLDPPSALKMGQALASFDDAWNWGLLASGDLSHRLIPDAPAGYSPLGKKFDDTVIRALSANDPQPLLELSPEELDAAGECGLRSIMALLGIREALGKNIEVLSYEGPFGVGYCNAISEFSHENSHLKSEFSRENSHLKEDLLKEDHPYIRLARATVTRLLGGEYLPVSGAEFFPEKSLWDMKRACFVSIKTLQGDLRGCVGTIVPTKTRLDLEVIANAVAASTQDWRFAPMKISELEGVTFSVDVLSELELVSDIKELDPAVWGIVISRGSQHGVLLPDLEGVDTIEQQIDIAFRKSGIEKHQDFTVYRFRVERYSESKNSELKNSESKNSESKI
ncbi:MAG: AmmeMemoRadiSam system protein A [Synergistaceae bacterium]|jgi:AmmeMemoRadiSam system protein A|nr:AmmeMemoRadiSam system protein A [Synergistaceae bacterium]